MESDFSADVREVIDVKRRNKKFRAFAYLLLNFKKMKSGKMQEDYEGFPIRSPEEQRNFKISLRERSKDLAISLASLAFLGISFIGAGYLAIQRDSPPPPLTFKESRHHLDISKGYLSKMYDYDKEKLVTVFGLFEECSKPANGQMTMNQITDSLDHYFDGDASDGNEFADVEGYAVRVELQGELRRAEFYTRTVSNEGDYRIGIREFEGIDSDAIKNYVKEAKAHLEDKKKAVNTVAQEEEVRQASDAPLAYETSREGSYANEAGVKLSGTTETITYIPRSYANEAGVKLFREDLEKLPRTPLCKSFNDDFEKESP